MTSSNADSYLWSTSETTQSIYACGSGTYAVTATLDSVESAYAVGVFISDFNESFDTPNGTVYSIYQNTGKLYFGGDFNYVGKVSSNIALIDNATGLFDSSMPRINGTVNCVIADGSGGWYVGGSFTKTGVYNYKNLVHINADKTVDADFKPEPNGEVKSLVLAGNKIYAAGNFTMVGEVSRGYLAQIDIHTGMATSWDPQVNGEVSSVVIYDNDIIAGGNFTNAGGQTRNFLAAIDTVYGQSTTWNPNPDQSVNRISLSGTKLYIAGNFTTIVATGRNKLACILLTTETLTSWNPNPNNIVYDILPTASS
ncbi:MAG: hypothetical protein HY738_08605, partial [Bacteroidia bacterium]|nr:hypothetical protein [Bacteroidia bacterium]